jgi:glycosyltransferase involved in cell wall biosynthesis
MIEPRYLLVMTLPCFEDAEGRRSLDELWHKDLVEHLAHIRHLTLAAPLLREDPTRQVIPIDHDSFEGTLEFVDLPPCRSTLATLASLPRIASRLWKAVGKAGIVHGNTGGWPISFSWLAIPMAKLRGKFTLTNVESGGWRLGFRPPYRPKSLIQAIVFESMARMIVNLSDVATFTQSGYRDTMLMGLRKDRGHIVCASWIDRGNILPLPRAEAIWAEKLADPSRPLRLVFAANLLTSKGLPVLLEALEELDRRGVPMVADLYGKGLLYDACVAMAGRLTGSVSLNLRGTLAYGEPFFEMLRGYDLMAVPSVSDEQPRVIYDCFSQALPVVASATPGVLECVGDGHHGMVVPIGDAWALADAIEWASRNRERLRDFGINALDVASSLTHDQMHAKRAAIIEGAMRPRAMSAV